MIAQSRLRRRPSPTTSFSSRWGPGQEAASRNAIGKTGMCLFLAMWAFTVSPTLKTSSPRVAT